MKTETSLTQVGADLVAEAESYPQTARELTVTNDKELEFANEVVKGIKALQKEIRAGYDDIIDKAHKAWKGAIAVRDGYLKPLEEAERMIKGKMAPYMEEQTRKVREAEEAMRKAQEEAEIAERKAEEDRQRKAREAIQDGDTKAAEEILAEPVPEFVPEIVDIPTVKKLEGTHARVTWEYEVVNINLVPRSLLMLDRVATNKLVQEQKERAKIPGIRVFQKTSVSTRG